MPSLGNLWYTLGIDSKQLDAEFKKINDKLKNAGSDLLINPKLAKSINEILPKGIKLELDPQLKAISNETLAKAAEGKVMRVEIMPLLTHLRKALKDATKDNPPEMEVGVQSAKLRKRIEDVLLKHGFMITVSTLNDNFTKVVQQKLNGTRYAVKIHADAAEITRSVQASLMQVQSRYFGLKVSRDILYRSIDEALGNHRFPIQIKVMQDQARKAVQDALLRAQVMGKDQALAYQRLQTGEMKAAQAELMRLKAAHMGAADAAKAHATASVSLGGAMGRNITIAGELGSAMTSIYSIHVLKEFLSQVIEIGGELEHQKIAMDTIFGDKGKTGELFGQIKGLARQSPFGVMELTKSVKALSAYGVEYNEIYDTAKRLADISAATSVDINRLILAFGKTKSRGFLDGLEAKQFAYANIPIYEMVRKKLEELEGQAVTTQEVMERMRKREIGFDIVKDVLWDITDPGGKFYDMQEALAGSVKTSWKLVRDNIELMFGEIAESAVGSGLKSVAEILQGLTREWRTVAAVVGTAAVGFGVYKVATLGVNSAVQKSTIATYNQIIAQKQKNAEELKAWGRITQLDRAEKMRIATANKLVNADLRQALREGKLTDKHIAQLFWQKKINAEQIKHLTNIGLLNPAMAKAILSNNRFTLSLQMMKQGLVSAGVAMKAFLLNPWTVTIAAISGIAALWQKHNEQLDKSKEIGDNLFTRATESAKNLKAVLAEIGNEVEKLTDIKIAEAISKLETAIKDYSPTPEKTLREARVDNSGNVRSSQEYVKALKAEVEAMQEAADLQEKIRIDDMSKNAMDNASGFLDDNLLKDLKDYADAYADADKKIGKYLVDNKKQAEEMVAIALKADPAFKKEAESLETLGEKFTLLAQQQSKFSLAWSAMSKNFYDKQAGIKAKYRDIWYIQLDWGNVGDGGLNGAKKEAFAELEQYMGYIKEELSRKSIEVGEGVDMSKPVQIMLANLGNTIFENIKSLPQDRQDELKEMWRTYFGLDFDDTVIFGDISENAKDGLDSLGKDLADKLRNGTTYNDLSDAEKEAVKKLIAESAQQTEKDMPHLTEKIKQALADESFIAKIAFTFGNYSGLDEWKQELIKIWGDGPEIVGVIKSAPDVLSAYKALAELKKETDDWLSKFGLVKLPVGFKYQPGKLFTEDELNKVTDPIAKQLMQDANSHIGIVNDLNSGQKASGVNLSDFEKSKNKGGNKKDKVVEDLKQRFKDIKDAWSEFQKWSKTEGREAAATRISESGLFSTLPKDKIPQTVEQYRALVVDIENELRKAGVKGTARESLLNDLLTQLLDIDKTVVDEQLKLALDKVSKEAERQLADWNLYEKVRKATGNETLAFNLAFGMNGDGQTDYVRLMKDRFDAIAKEYGSAFTYDTATQELLQKEGIQEVQKAYEQTYGDISKYHQKESEEVADILAKYQSLQDKFAKIDYDRNEEIRRINESKDLTPEQKAQTIHRINVEADYQKFTQGADYLKFFSGIYSLTMQQAQEIGDKIRLNLDQRLQAGAISAEEYYKEIERINQQLAKLRNVKSDAMTLLTGGVKGLQQKKLDKANSDVLAQTREAQKAQEELEKAKATGDIMQITSARIALNLAEKELETRTKIRDAIVKDMEGWQNVLDVVNLVANIAGGVSDAFGSIRDMAEAYGADIESNGWLDVGGVLDTLTSVTDGVSKVVQSAMNGDVGGILGGVVSTITSPFTIWSKLHDKKLQKLIDRSKQAAQIMQNQYDILEKRMANFLGNAANMKVEGYSGEGGAYGKQLELMKGQLAELEKQRQAEIDKKKTDNSVVEDYNKQIEEMKISIRNFAEEAANAIYGIDLNGWAQQIGDALVDAFAKGEDAAEAFDKTVADIMRSVVKNIIATEVIAPAFEKLRDYLFGDDGVFANYKTGGDFKLSAQDAAGLAKVLESTKGSVEDAKEIYDLINNLTGGMLDDTEKTKSVLSAGIQSVTEDTADLLASYLNAVRADVSIQTYELWPRLLDVALPQISVIAQSQLVAQRQIAENTLRAAKAAESLVQLSTSMESSWRRIAMKEWGYY